ncbi:MAG: ABC transporter substrate-binding protein [Clostridia bacterium]|nr:ABC transporter substrate-binding protein [Clostridia bacterium]
MKRFLIVLLSVSMLLAITVGCQSETAPTTTATTESKQTSTASETTKAPAPSGEEAVEQIVMVYQLMRSIPPDNELVQNEINAYIKDLIHVSIELVPISMGDYTQQVTLMITSKEDMDLMCTMPGGPLQFSNMTAQNQLLDITDLLNEYGQGIIESIENVNPKYLDATKIKGRYYAVPSNYNKVTNMYVSIRKDVLAEQNLDLKAVKNMADLEAILETLRENYDIPPLAYAKAGSTLLVFTNGILNFDHFEETIPIDTLGDGDFKYGIIKNNDNYDIINFYETDDYKKIVEKAHEWYTKGYIYPDAATAEESSSDIVRANGALGNIVASERGVEQLENNRCGHEMEVTQIGTGLVATNNLQKFTWALPVTCKKPEAAMKFLNLTYTDEHVINLLNFGIEGVHYVVTEDGTIDFPEGVTAETTRYGVFMDFLFGNQFLAKVWKGNPPNLRELSLEDNRNAEVTNTAGFVVVSTEMQDQLAAVTNVLQQYRPFLESGTSDPTTALPEMQNALQAAGFQEILDEVQRQLNDWLSNQ